MVRGKQQILRCTQDDTQLQEAGNSASLAGCHSEERRDEESAFGGKWFGGNSRSFVALRMTPNFRRRVTLLRSQAVILRSDATKNLLLVANGSGETADPSLHSG